MTLLLKSKPGRSSKSGETWQAPPTVNLEENPCPAVMANGVNSVGHGQYWLEDDGMDAKTDAGKPPYRVPSMEEIAAVPWNGLKVASLFAGCGGSSLGYRMAGYRMVYANEFVPAALECYRANASEDTILDGRDVREVTPEAVLEACGLAAGELDVLDGSPPCQAFSTAGRRHRNWGQERKYEHGAYQKNEDLFAEFIRMLRGIRPRAFVAENVSGLVKGVAKGYFIEILRELKASGYRVEARVLDAQWLGVPQCRARVFFVGVRDDLGLAPVFPVPLSYRYSVRDALPWLDGARVGTNKNFEVTYQSAEVPAPTVVTAAGKSGVVRSARAIHETLGQPQYSAGDITSRPAPTVAAGAAHHFLVEGPVGFNKHKGSATDRPMPAVMAGRPVSVIDDGRHRDKTQGLDQPAPTITYGRGNGAGVQTRRVRADDTVAENVAPSIEDFAIGDEYARLNPGQTSGKYFNLIKPAPDQPCPTITALGESFPPGGAAAVCHPTERRKFTIGELKRICAFPDSFIVTGTYGAQWERLGNAVPPLMMFAEAVALRDQVFAKLPKPDNIAGCKSESRKGSGRTSRKVSRKRAGRGKARGSRAGTVCSG